MYQTLIRSVLALGLPLALCAQLPAIYPHGVVNSASFLAPGLPGGSIAQGSVFTVFGSALGPATGVAASSFPLGTSLSGVTISVTQGTTTVSAYPLYVSQGQINALMPSNAPLGAVSVRVVHNNAFSNPSPVNVVHDSVGMYTFTGTGLGPAALQNAASNGTLPLNTNQASAKPGQTAVVYLTGLGPISAPDNQPPPAGNLPTPVAVWVGGVPATVAYSGRSPCCAGLDQIDFVVPPAAPTGCWVPVVVWTSNANISNTTSMAIDANGAPCTDAANPFSAALIKGSSTGTVSLIRTAVHEDVSVNAPIDISSDTFSFSANQQPGGPFVFTPFAAAPPPGTCTVYPGIGDYWSTGMIPDSTAFTALDGGSQFTVAGSGGPQQVTLTGGTAALGGNLPLYGLPSQLVLTPGNFTVSGAGGANVGAMNVPITVPSPITWTNRDQTTLVNRSQPLTISWTGGQGQTIQILGENSDLPTNSSSLFYCVAPAGATSLTVPPQVLAAIPATRANWLDSTGVIFVTSSSQATFNQQGLSAAFATAVYKTGKTVVFQ